MPIRLSIFAILGILLISAQQVDPSRGTLRWYAQEARTRGQRSITVPYPRYSWAEVTRLEDVPNQTSVVTASLISSVTVAREREIITWCKFRLQETVLVQSTIPPDTLEDAPTELLPIGSDEFLVPLTGGVAQVDGIEVTMAQPFEPTVLGQSYLLFVTFFENGKIGAPTYGPSGFFYLNGSDELRSIMRTTAGALELELQRNRAGNLTDLKKWLSSRIAR